MPTQLQRTQSIVSLLCSDSTILAAMRVPISGCLQRATNCLCSLWYSPALHVGASGLHISKSQLNTSASQVLQAKPPETSSAQLYLPARRPTITNALQIKTLTHSHHAPSPPHYNPFPPAPHHPRNHNLCLLLRRNLRLSRPDPISRKTRPNHERLCTDVHL